MTTITMPTLHVMTLIINGNTIEFPAQSLASCGGMLHALRVVGVQVEVISITPLYKKG